MVSSERHPGDGTLGFLAVALACAVSAGLVVITATVLAVDLLRASGDPGTGIRLYLLFGGTLAGILLAGVTAWHLLGPITSTYRRGGLALVCAFATVLAMLICIPVNQLLGHTGLIGLLLLCGTAAALLARQAFRLRTRV